VSGEREVVGKLGNDLGGAEGVAVREMLGLWSAEVFFVVLIRDIMLTNVP
jgi:hypothetical protein